MNQPDTSVTDLRERIRRCGLRGTPARVAVLQRLEQADHPLTHAEIAAGLVPEGFDKATVYRCLIDLTEAGLLSRSELGDHAWRFEMRRESAAHPGEHPHFLCVDCGDVVCLSDVRISISPAPGSKQSRISELTEVLLKGHCERCRA